MARRRPSGASAGASGGRLGRQEARWEAVLRARRPSWAPGGPSGGRLERQEARRRPSWAPGGPSAGRLGREEPRIVGFADSSSEIVGFAQSAGKAQAAGMGVSTSKVPTPPSRTGQFLYRCSKTGCIGRLELSGGPYLCLAICSHCPPYDLQFSFLVVRTSVHPQL